MDFDMLSHQVSTFTIEVTEFAFQRILCNCPMINGMILDFAYLSAGKRTLQQQMEQTNEVSCVARHVTVQGHQTKPGYEEKAMQTSMDY